MDKASVLQIIAIVQEAINKVIGSFWWDIQLCASYIKLYGMYACVNAFYKPESRNYSNSNMTWIHLHYAVAKL